MSAPTTNIDEFRYLREFPVSSDSATSIGAVVDFILKSVLAILHFQGKTTIAKPLDLEVGMDNAINRSASTLFLLWVEVASELTAVAEVINGTHCGVMALTAVPDRPAGEASSRDSTGEGDNGESME
jgi:hypothetical protein